MTDRPEWVPDWVPDENLDWYINHTLRAPWDELRFYLDRLFDPVCVRIYRVMDWLARRLP
ncbi:hypothetical protein DFO66_103361 [Brevibacterium sanguinis]|uniref:Uncharacterized protein n=2 Tax=Brevibacterium TaxID=1696 RepID=A0A366INK4_9MICO|nr:MULTISPECIES: hypothetical protein [Brevibacterium]RBP66414.1 hypothetical protein DFO66_103361 [Brevibacterium sanguinis]RBP73066.1 hypothetical protein DFO65_103361 [Brevibacterium celere]